MEQKVAPSDAGQAVSNDKTDVTMTGEFGNRYEFDYDGHIDAHKLPDGYEFLGFGSGWFAIGEV